MAIREHIGHFKKWWNELDKFYPALVPENKISEDLDPYKDFDGFSKRRLQFKSRCFRR